jgi:hypothetical protein
MFKDDARPDANSYIIHHWDDENPNQFSPLRFCVELPDGLVINDCRLWESQPDGVTFTSPHIFDAFEASVLRAVDARVAELRVRQPRKHTQVPRP